jgi:hypothetical protein
MHTISIPQATQLKKTILFAALDHTPITSLFPTRCRTSSARKSMDCCKHAHEAVSVAALSINCSMLYRITFYIIFHHYTIKTCYTSSKHILRPMYIVHCTVNKNLIVCSLNRNVLVQCAYCRECLLVA